MANRITVNKERYLSQHPELRDQKGKKDVIENEEEEEISVDALPHLSLINMSKGFTAFVSKIGPLVAGWQALYDTITIKDTRNTLTFLFVVSYAIIYQE